MSARTASRALRAATSVVALSSTSTTPGCDVIGRMSLSRASAMHDSSDACARGEGRGPWPSRKSSSRASITLYRPPSGRPVLALEDVSLEVGNREFLALLGPSGCGKSTLLYLIGGFLPIETGKHPDRGQAGRRARARPRHRVPAFRAVSLEDRARQHPLRPRAHGACRARSASSARNRSSTWSG